MFRSVAHGACKRSGQSLPDEELQRQLADELRQKVSFQFLLVAVSFLKDCHYLNTTKDCEVEYSVYNLPFLIVSLITSNTGSR